jgi:transcriptional regulator with XRE-family HTH domain
MNFGQKLRKLRMGKDLTQQLAKKLGYKTNSYISDVKSGIIPSKEKLKKIARALNIPFKILDDMLWNLGLKVWG